MVAKRRLCLHPFAKYLEMSIGRQMAPDGGERIAPAEVDSTDEPTRGSVFGFVCRVKDQGFFIIGIDKTRARDELAPIFLADPALSKRLGLFGDELGADAWALCPGDGDPCPGVGARPLGVEPAAASIGRRKGDNFAIACGDHRADRFVEGVLDTGRLVNHQKTYAAYAANGGFAPGQGEHTGAVSEIDPVFCATFDIDGVVDSFVPGEDLLEQFPRLAQTGRK